MSKQKILLKPKRIKFARHHKGRVKFLESRRSSCDVVRGGYGLQVLYYQRCLSKTDESVRRMISRKLKTKEKIWFRKSVDTPVTKKPAQIRMGKGKGGVLYWMYSLRAGSIISEIGELEVVRAHYILKRVQKKLGAPTAIRTRPNKLPVWIKPEYTLI